MSSFSWTSRPVVGRWEATRTRHPRTSLSAPNHETSRSCRWCHQTHRRSRRTGDPLPKSFTAPVSVPNHPRHHLPGRSCSFSEAGCSQVSAENSRPTMLRGARCGGGHRQAAHVGKLRQLLLADPAGRMHRLFTQGTTPLQCSWEPVARLRVGESGGESRLRAGRGARTLAEEGTCVHFTRVLRGCIRTLNS